MSTNTREWMRVLVRKNSYRTWTMCCPCGWRWSAWRWVEAIRIADRHARVGCYLTRPERYRRSA